MCFLSNHLQEEEERVCATVANKKGRNNGEKTD